MYLEQAIYGNPGQGGFRWLARSPGFRDEWLEPARDLCTRFGDRPTGVACPEALLVVPLDQHKRQQAIIRVADQGEEETGRPGALLFRLLIVPQPLYVQLGADPFRLDETYEPDWQARQVLPSLPCTLSPPLLPTVERLARILDVAPERTAWLLGSAQILVDGGKVWLERPLPETRLVRELWELLPYSTRAELRLATFCFGNAHQLHLAVAPPQRRGEFVHFTPEEAAGEYPEGHYELALQTAVESGDQAGLEALLLRRSRRQTWQMGLLLLLVMVVVAFLSRLPTIGSPTPTEPPAAQAPMPTFETIPAFDIPSALEAQRRTGELVRELGDAGDTPSDLDRALAKHLKPRHPTADVASMPNSARQLRALLWKFGIADADNPHLSVAELFARLREALDRRK